MRSRIHALLGAKLCSLLVVQACGGEVTENSQGSGASTPTCPSFGTDGSGSPYVLTVSIPALLACPMFTFDAIVHVDGGEMCMSIRPLAAADRTTPVGPPEDGGPYALADSGLFVAHYALVIPKEADADYGGGDRDIPADFQLEAQEPTCGSVAGCYYPVGPLCNAFDGSPFALTPLSDPDARARPILDCSGRRAAPL